MERLSLRPDREALLGYAAAVGAVAAVTVVIALIEEQVRIANISMLYLLAVIATAVAYGQRPAVLASALAFLAFDFFFIDPVHTFTVSDPSEWVALLLFLLTAMITGQLAARQRLRADEAEQREHEAALLYDIARLMTAPDSSAAMQSVAARLLSELGLAAVRIEIDPYGDMAEASIDVGSEPALYSMRSGAPAPFRLLSEGAAPTAGTRATPGRWVRGVVSGTAARDDAYRSEVVPIRAGSRRLGVLVAAYETASSRRSLDQRLLSAVASQIGSVVELDRYRRDATEAEALRRTDELKTALLNAVSHDLRTPLSSIIASAESLQQTDVDWTDAERHEFAEAIEHQAQRLNQIVGNLLDLSRIESGSLRPDKGWYDLAALLDEVIGRLKPSLAGHSISLSVDETLPPIALDYVEIDEVLTNLIENASKYTPAGTEIAVSAARLGPEVVIEVADRGPGIPEAALVRLFEPFYRGEVTGVKGSGLGLAVARGLIEAHGGHISALNRPGGGAVFRFTLPLSAEEPPQSVEGAR